MRVLNEVLSHRNFGYKLIGKRAIVAKLVALLLSLNRVLKSRQSFHL